MSQSDRIIMYGAMWCKDCVRAKQFFDDHDITFTFVDVDADAEASAIVKSINNGMRIIPTIVFPDETILVEPSNQELAQHFGILT